MPTATIDIGRDFTRYPAGRYRTDGHFSGEKFREELLAPALRSNEIVVLELDNVVGYGSSFLEETFGGLIRSGEFTKSQLINAVQLHTNDDSLVEEIREYIDTAVDPNRAP